jgi:D-beta-D-heptose 7-phosphate kinase/D-beta-D-heptose 1-phosphate adenosyltransferase
MSVKNILSGGVCLKDRYIPDYDELKGALGLLRAIGKTIVMTQGVYDLIHPGHTRYLEQAASFGDILVVAVDTDEYTRLRKQRANERRPVVPFEERLELLANMRSVDILTIRDLKEHREDPDFVIKVVKPDVLVMSRSTKDVGLGKLEELKSLCGRLEVLDPQATVSTTARLRDLLIDGASGLVDHITTAIEEYFDQAGRKVVFGQKKGGEGE